MLILNKEKAIERMLDLMGDAHDPRPPEGAQARGRIHRRVATFERRSAAVSSGHVRPGGRLQALGDATQY